MGLRQGFGKERLFLSDRNPRGQARSENHRMAKNEADTDAAVGNQLVSEEAGAARLRRKSRSRSMGE